MGVNSRMFWILSGFFLLAAVVYVVWTLVYEAQGLAQDPGAGGYPGPRIEWVGSIGLFLGGVASALIAFYVGRTHQAQGAELPADRVDAEIDDGDAEQGFFSPHSVWPVVLGASAAVVFLGVAVGFWLSILGAGFLIVALVGLVLEYHRGYFRH